MKQHGRTESKDADNFPIQFLFFNLLNNRLPSQNKMTSDITNIREPSWEAGTLDVSKVREY